MSSRFILIFKFRRASRISGGMQSKYRPLCSAGVLTGDLDENRDVKNAGGDTGATVVLDQGTAESRFPETLRYWLYLCPCRTSPGSRAILDWGADPIRWLSTGALPFLESPNLGDGEYFGRGLNFRA